MKTVVGKDGRDDSDNESMERVSPQGSFTESEEISQESFEDEQQASKKSPEFGKDSKTDSNKSKNKVTEL